MKPAMLAGGLLLAALSWGCSGPEITGPAATYVNQGCAKCHGEQLDGTRTAPPLTGLAEHWAAEDLATYLRDPEPFLEASPRMRTQAESYPVPMPAYPDLPETDLSPLVDYLLTYGAGKEDQPSR